VRRRIPTSDFALIFDCESRLSPDQSLTFGFWRFCELRNGEYVVTVLQGTVTDRNTGQPISGTGIFLCTSCGAMTTTDANGQYSLTAAQLGNRQSATLLFQAQGYFVAQVSYTITTTPTTLNVTLLPGGSVVQGTITDSATGAPIVGASVGVSNNAQTMNGLSTTSGAGGQYSIDSSKLMEASAGGFNSSGLFVSGLAGYFNYLGPAFQVGPPYPVTL
jgi:hypothetical protein